MHPCDIQRPKSRPACRPHHHHHPTAAGYILHSREESDKTFIVVSHDMDFIKDICDLIALIKSRKIIQIGKAAEVLASLTNEKEREQEK